MSSLARSVDDSTLVTVSLTTTLVVAAVVLVLVMANAAVRFVRLGVPGKAFGDRLRSYGYLERFGAALDLQGVGGRGRRSAVAELRANLAEASKSAGMSKAIAALGSPRRLAASIAEGRVRPTWLAGGLAAAIAIPMSVAIHAVALSIWVSAAQVGGAETAQGTAPLLPGVEFSFDRAIDSGITSIWLAVLPLLAFAFWSRPWRLLTRRWVGESA